MTEYLRDVYSDLLFAHHIVADVFRVVMFQASKMSDWTALRVLTPGLNCFAR